MNNTEIKILERAISDVLAGTYDVARAYAEKSVEKDYAALRAALQSIFADTANLATSI